MLGTRKEEEQWTGLVWEYRARNLGKVAGVALENDFNSFGQEGWELVTVAKDYAVFKRPLEPSRIGESV